LRQENSDPDDDDESRRHTLSMSADISTDQPPLEFTGRSKLYILDLDSQKLMRLKSFRRIRQKLNREITQTLYDNDIGNGEVIETFNVDFDFQSEINSDIKKRSVSDIHSDDENSDDENPYNGNDLQKKRYDRSRQNTRIDLALITAEAEEDATIGLALEDLKHLL
jgi:hypothetical protein